jgi:flagellar protein FliO/FliZ
MHKRYAVYMLVCLFLVVSASIVGAQEAAPDYLKYQEPQPTSISFLSTISYIFSLLVTFAVVIGLAFYTSRFMGKKMGSFNNSPDGKVMSSLALGPKSYVYVVEIAGKYLVLGVTEHNINLLHEITNVEEIAALKQKEPVNPAKSQFEVLFQNHIHSLREMSNKFPAVFGARENSQENEGEKR